MTPSTPPSPENPPRPRRTRLAPSPTGSLHLGHARSFLLTWALARTQGWEILLRLEDLDRERVKPGSIDETRATLDWLGLQCDGDASIQSEHVERFREAMRRLAAQRRVFRCDRSRKDVRMASSAPHRDDAEVRYDPSLRPVARPDDDPYRFERDDPNHRFRVEPGAEMVHDELQGLSTFDPGAEVGDFLVWTKLGVPSYQLAVMVDDAHQGITDVVRGEDLLASAARQQLLYRALDATPPRWWHLPLVYDAQGERLAKRRGDIGLSALRSAGVSSERVIGLIAYWSGLGQAGTGAPSEISLADFQPLVTPDTLRCLAQRERTPSLRCTASEESISWLLNR